MLRWATNTLESLAQTVAPPPTDPYSRIYFACQKRDENGVMDILQSEQQQQQQQGMMMIHPTQTIIHEVKGYTLFHLACLFSLSQVLEYCLGILQQQEPHPSQYLSVRDKEGNTPLHCAVMSNHMEAFDIIKRLLSIESSARTNAGTTGNIYPPIITVQNLSGKTPYDVATVNSIRQYLLPLQLQAETQMAIDNGGIGLPPGIDMGGLTIPNAAQLPPPPTNVAMYSGHSGLGNAGGGTMYAPIPGLNVSSSNPAPIPTSTIAPPVPASLYPPTTPIAMVPNALQEQQQQQQQPNHQTSSLDGQYSSPTNFCTASTTAPINATSENQNIGTVTAMPPMPVRQEPPQQRHVSSSSTNDLTTPQAIPRPPNSTGSLTVSSSSSSYALTGRSSAAIFTKSTKGGIQPDGFHSSSSDKNLQEKYGHVNVSNSALPPPPSSGNFTPDMTIMAQKHQQPLSAPPSMSGSNNSSSYVNPFAGGMAAAATGALRSSARRYVTYDPISSSSSSSRPSQLPLQQSIQPQQQPAAMYPPYNQFQPPQQQQLQQPLPSQMQQQPFNPMLNSNNSNQQQLPPQPASSVSFTIPSAPISGSNSLNTFSSPNAFIGKTPANTPMLSSVNTTTASATSTFMSPPPSGMAASFGTDTTQPVTLAQQSFPSSSSPDRSSNTAASVFGTPTLMAPVASLPAQADIAAPPAAQHGYHRSNSTTSDAAALFAKPITIRENAETIPATPSAATATDCTPIQQPESLQQSSGIPHSDIPSDVQNTAGFVQKEEEDDLDDVPLTPGQNVTSRTNEAVTHEQALATNETQHQQPLPQPPLSNAVNSLISAIGMPPPPFSRK